MIKTKENRFPVLYRYTSKEIVMLPSLLFPSVNFLFSFFSLISFWMMFVMADVAGLIPDPTSHSDLSRGPEKATEPNMSLGQQDSN